MYDLRIDDSIEVNNQIVDAILSRSAESRTIEDMVYWGYALCIGNGSWILSDKGIRVRNNIITTMPKTFINERLV